jgi:hypothetical protein
VKQQTRALRLSSGAAHASGQHRSTRRRSRGCRPSRQMRLPRREQGEACHGTGRLCTKWSHGPTAAICSVLIQMTVHQAGSLLLPLPLPPSLSQPLTAPIGVGPGGARRADGSAGSACAGNGQGEQRTRQALGSAARPFLSPIRQPPALNLAALNPSNPQVSLAAQAGISRTRAWCRPPSRDHRYQWEEATSALVKSALVK